MKTKLLFLLLASFTLITLSSCSKDDEFEDELSSLYHTTDYFVDMLDKVYEHYDAFGKYAKDSSDGRYTVTPLGRMIVVKKKYSSNTLPYTSIQKGLENHYKKNHVVKEVYLNNAGTVTIDCRK